MGGIQARGKWRTLGSETKTGRLKSAWTALATNTLESELLYFTDLGATNSPCRFYRLRLN
jgi:hypothetical protein